MTRNIKIPNCMGDEKRFIHWYQTLNLQDIKKNSKVRLDISAVSFVIPFCAIGLLAICRQMDRRIKKRVLLTGFQEPVYQYLERMDFFRQTTDFIRPDHSAAQLWDRSPRSPNLLEITKISRDREEGSNDVIRIAHLIHDRARDILGNWLTKKRIEIERFVTVLSEICQNIFEHSQDDGFVIIQKYFGNRTQSNFLSIAVVDCGVGIRRTLEPKIKETYSKESLYLADAFKLGISRSGAGGLYKVRESVQRWKGALLVWSGKAVLFQKSETTEFTHWNDLQYFTGTNISIWIPE